MSDGPVVAPFVVSFSGFDFRSLLVKWNGFLDPVGGDTFEILYPHLVLILFVTFAALCLLCDYFLKKEKKLC